MKHAHPRTSTSTRRTRQQPARPELPASILESTGITPADHLLALQQTVGNQAVQRLFAGTYSALPVGVAIQRVSTKVNWKGSEATLANKAVNVMTEVLVDLGHAEQMYQGALGAGDTANDLGGDERNKLSAHIAEVKKCITFVGKVHDHIYKKYTVPGDSPSKQIIDQLTKAHSQADAFFARIAVIEEWFDEGFVPVGLPAVIVPDGANNNIALALNNIVQGKGWNRGAYHNTQHILPANSTYTEYYIRIRGVAGVGERRIIRSDMNPQQVYYTDGGTHPPYNAPFRPYNLGTQSWGTPLVRH